MNDDGADAAERLLGLIGEHRDSIREALDDEEHALLLTRLAALADTAPGDDRAVRRALQGVRLALLPLPLAHPVREELDSIRLVAAPPGPSTVAGAQELMTWLTLPPPPTEPAYTLDAGQQQLLRAPALTTDETWARCGGAPPAELIRLADPHDGDRYPEFQFPAGTGSPHQVVLRVNRLLLADIDPWGAATWWLSGNTWLGGTPASLLGRLPDHRLVGAAGALAEGE
ncbi:hypothetical protein ACWC10_33255 [Streptomyces sp. NPDC001595]|uniref:hypothetical protein n=1 Tax=Streptomyces sp. NPDC001532 TaxID=3154520 RepID=UPI00332902AA